MPFKWVLICPGCKAHCSVTRAIIRIAMLSKAAPGVLVCSACKKQDKIDFGLDLEGEDQLTFKFSSPELVESMRSKFSKTSDLELTAMRDEIDIKKHGTRSMVILTHILQEMERRKLE